MKPSRLALSITAALLSISAGSQAFEKNKISTEAENKQGITAQAISALEVGNQTVKNTNNKAKKEGEPEAENQATEAAETEKITVTGTRIKRDSFSVATPISIIGKSEIEDAGIGALSEILIDEMTQVVEGVSNTNSQSSITTTGLSTIDLRQLGTSRTLTLIDGRRVVSNSHSGNYVSMSTIPAGMVDRVEIITGGASAAYGSDAIAGVVNIITESDKQGFGFNARHGESTEGGGKELTLDVEYGNTFNNDKGYFLVSATYDKQYGLDYWDRERAQQQEYIRYDGELMCNSVLTAQGRVCLRDTDSSQWTNLSDSIPGGVFDESSSTEPNSGFWYDKSGLRDDWHEEVYGIDTNQFVMLKIPESSTSVALKLDYELNSGTELYWQAQFSHNTSFNNKSPESEDEYDLVIVYDPSTETFGETVIGRIPLSNPFVPDEIYQEASSKGIKWDRNFAEVGRISTSNTRNTLRTWAGARGETSDGQWQWDASLGYGRFTQKQLRANEINVVKARQALNAEYAEDGVTIQCADEAARAEGCVPLNLFGEGSITAEAADYIRANPKINSQVEQITALGYITGNLIELPAGAVNSAFGFEYRKDSQQLEVGGGAENGGVTFNYVPSYSGDMSVKEVFGEVSIPLIRNAAFAEHLYLDASARFADYSWQTSDIMESYKLGFMWHAFAGISLRANWATAQRAPTIDDLNSPIAGDYDSYYDICDGVTATSTQSGHDNCRKEASIAQWIADNPGEAFDDDNNGYSPSLGNESLTEEKAETYTVGVTYTPEFLPEAHLALDYFDIAIEDALSTYSNNDIIQFCYDSQLPHGEGNTFCDAIKRNEEGQLVEVQQKTYNVDEIATRGYDVALSYRHDLEQYGSLKFKASLTHLIDYSKTVLTPNGLETTRYENALYMDQFQDKASASVSWRKDNWRVRWSTRYKSPVPLSINAMENWQRDMDDNTARCEAGEETCITNPEPLSEQYYSMPSYIKHKLSVSYYLDLNHDGEMRLYAGVNNIFDNKGPFVLGGKGNFDGNYGGGMGRFYYLGAELSF